MLIENTLFGVKDKVSCAIDRFRTFEPPEGYYLAFSGGKDSQCIYQLAKEAGVTFDAHYNITTVDPPEVIYFIRNHYPDVIAQSCGTSMWQLIETRGLPTRRSRFCCDVLKEHGGEGRICITGVRWSESRKRKNNRKPFEILGERSPKALFNDNDEDRHLFENCSLKGKRIINPIIDWDEDDVWEYITSRRLPYCCLYDQGFKRIGCIGCPLSSNMKFELDRYPKYRDNYLRAIRRNFIHCEQSGKSNNLYGWKNSPERCLEWWIKGGFGKQCDGQLELSLDPVCASTSGSSSKPSSLKHDCCTNQILLDLYNELEEIA